MPEGDRKRRNALIPSAPRRAQTGSRIQPLELRRISEKLTSCQRWLSSPAWRSRSSSSSSSHSRPPSCQLLRVRVACCQVSQSVDISLYSIYKLSAQVLRVSGRAVGCVCLLISGVRLRCNERRAPSAGFCAGPLTRDSALWCFTGSGGSRAGCVACRNQIRSAATEREEGRATRQAAEPRQVTRLRESWSACRSRS